MEIIDIFNEQFDGFTHIVFGEIHPKIGIYNALLNNREIIENDPALVLIVNALEIDIKITLAKLLDGNRSERNIIKFINFCETNSKHIPWKGETSLVNMVKKHKELLDANEDSINRLCKQRDKYFAHYDKKYFQNKDKLEEDFIMPFKEIIKIINIFGKIVSEINLGYKGSSPISIGDMYNAYMYNVIKWYKKGKEIWETERK
jgi:hypothetical protein